MNYIDKSSTAYSSRFNTISDRLIAADIISYKDVGDADRAAMKQVVHTEQHGLCAYCMQSVPTSTGDHVVPRSIPVGQFPGKGRYRHDMVHTKTWSASIHMEGGQVRYYPHDIAYGNYVMACGECNRRKDNRKIYPVFFDNPTGISYDEDGLMLMPPDALCAELRAYLNDEVNRKWRRLWCKAKQSGVTDTEICNAADKTDRIKLLKRILSAGTPNPGDYKLNPGDYKLVQDASWNIFVSFRWFYTYYRL